MIRDFVTSIAPLSPMSRLATKLRALTKSLAKRIWLRAQRLDIRAPFGEGPEATRAAVEHLGYVQIDTIHVIERCHHHILYTRIQNTDASICARLRVSTRPFSSTGRMLCLTSRPGTCGSSSPLGSFGVQPRGLPLSPPRVWALINERMSRRTGRGHMLTVWGRRSSFNLQKVMWLVGELGIEHLHIEAGGRFVGLDTPEFRAINPHGRVPVIDDDGTIVWESHAILRYLAARYGRGSFWSDDAATRSLSDRWMDWAQTSLQPDFLLGVFWGFYRTPEPQRDLACHQGADQQVRKALSAPGSMACRSGVHAG